MSRVLFPNSYAGAVEVFWAREILDPASTESILRSLKNEAHSMVILREMLKEEMGVAELARLSDQDVIDQLVLRAKSGSVRMTRQTLKRLTGGGVTLGRASQPPPAETAPRRGSAPPPGAAPSEPPPQQCCNPACAGAFKGAAESGTPFVERGTSGC